MLSFLRVPEERNILVNCSGLQALQQKSLAQDTLFLLQNKLCLYLGIECFRMDL